MVVVTLLYQYRMVYPPNYTAKPSSGCVHDITYDGHTGRRRLDCVPLLYLRVADTLTLTLNSHTHTSHTHTHAARVRESSRVRTDGGTYILLDYYYCSYSIITQQQQQQQQQSTYARNSTLTATTCSRSTNSSS